MLVVDCWSEPADESIIEEKEHGSSTFVVVAPAVNENMAADRNIQCYCLGGGGGAEW